MLIARDEQSCLVVTFKEIKACLEGAFACVANTFERICSIADFIAAIFHMHPRVPQDLQSIVDGILVLRYSGEDTL